MNSTRALTICQACAVAAFIAFCVVVELAGYATARQPRGYEPRDHFDHTTPVRHGPLPSPELQVSTLFMSSGTGTSTPVYCPLYPATTVVCGY